LCNLKSKLRFIDSDAMSYISDLQDAIRRVHGVESTHLESVPVKEIFQGKTVWDGAVEVFLIHGHPKAARVYAWTYDTGESERAKTPRHLVAYFPGRIRRGCCASGNRGGF
jgi:hypothetical protein